MNFEFTTTTSLKTTSERIKKNANKSCGTQCLTGSAGLEFYNNHLYAIQNGAARNSYNFRKLILNKVQDAIIGVEVIDSHTPRLNVPLTFCLAGDKAVVIGNSNLQYLNQENYEFSDADTIPLTKLLVYEIE